VSEPVTVISPTPPRSLRDLLARPTGDALMLGHAHPDGDVLGTLLALGSSLEAGGWTLTYAGPHPIPDTLAFLPGASRWRVWSVAPRIFDVIVLTDCPNDARTEGLLAAARGDSSQSAEHRSSPDNRGYGT
jgi:nanoRNase/pAp phosphatase (c-di-AMP/oligoRNAs hydrolase)